MTSDGIPDNIPVTRLVQGSRARTSDPVFIGSGKTVLPSGEDAPAVATPPAVPAHVAPQPARVAAQLAPASIPSVHAPEKPDAAALVIQLNKHVSNSGRPDQFRLDAAAGRIVIQQVKPDSGEVIAEYPEAEFPTLAQGLSGVGLLINTRA